MDAFDKIIGYETIKKELEQICDMLSNKEVYQKLGAKLPHGVMLYGEPGLGKSLMARCLIEKSGLKSYTVRRNKSSKEFVNEIGETFQSAKKNAPCIVFLDDMDKFANEDYEHPDAEEYVAIQAAIDDVKDAEVLVIATVNDINSLPDSLVRSGRFDRKIEIFCPTEEDSCKIIKHYLSDKPVSEEIDLTDIAMMINYSSCAELETILNEASINAAFARHDKITYDDIVTAVLRKNYDSPNTCAGVSDEEMEKVALHEAGHLVVCEVLCPGGVGLASVKSNGMNRTGGFIKRCKDIPRKEYNILISLAGKAATELYYAESFADGCNLDLERAINYIRDNIAEKGSCGLGFIDVEAHHARLSENLNSRSEAAVYAELERYMLKTREILLKNRYFLEQATEALVQKETLLHSDIKALRKNSRIVSVTV